MKWKDIHTVCINLKTRPDKRKLMIQQAKRLKLPLTFYLADPHPTSGARGCLESHIEVIKMGLKNKWRYLLVLEDDALFNVKKLPKLRQIPQGWDMLYLGGNVNIKYVEEQVDISKMEWVPVSTWTTHAYIIDLSNKWVIERIMASVDQEKEIDKYYINQIHYRKQTYMHNPMICIQRPGWSDIEKAEVKYDKMPLSLTGLPKPEHKIENTEYTLVLPKTEDSELPYVSIITPTYERRDIFTMALMNFNNFIYPAEKMEWVIIDDSPTPESSVKELLPKDPRIRFVRLKSNSGERLTVAAKRNFGAQVAKHDIIIHMDDDDYYPPESILARVKVLLKYPEIGCVGSSVIGTYDLMEDKSRISTDGTLSMAEATMAYKRWFWEQRHFDDHDIKGEYFKFITDRYDQVMDVPYTFIIYAITHYNNLTGKGRRIEENALIDVLNGEDRNYRDMWPIDVQVFVTELRKHLLKTVYPEKDVDKTEIDKTEVETTETDEINIDKT